MFEPTQAHLLEAMGYQLLLRPQSQPAALPPPVVGQSPAPAPARVAAPEISAPATPANEHPLWTAVLASAALTPERAHASGLRRASSGVAVEYLRDELWIDPLALRGSPSDKRRLWKALRALRRAELARAELADSEPGRSG